MKLLAFDFARFADEKGDKPSIKFVQLWNDKLHTQVSIEQNIHVILKVFDKRRIPTIAILIINLILV